MAPEAAFLLFWLVLALTGGSARVDATYLLVLRAVTVLCLFVFLVSTTPRDWRVVRGPLSLLAALSVVIAIQLVPIPPSLWHELPGRERFAKSLELAGAGDTWLTLSLAPDRTWNSLVALLVPAAALFGYAAIGDRARRFTISGLLVLGVASAGLGAVQLATANAFLLYVHADIGYSIGLFANKNHEALLLSLLLPALRGWSLTIPSGGTRSRVRPMIAAGVGAVLVPAIVVTGSRAGLLMLPVGLAGAWLVRPVVADVRRLSRLTLLGICAGVALAAISFVLVIASGHAFAIERLLKGGAGFSDPRITNAGTVMNALRAGFPVGWGWGTFDPIYRAFEPDRLLRLTYFNNAHDDLLELGLTGGLPALMILIAFLVWASRMTMKTFASPAIMPNPTARAAAIMVAMTLLGSLVDYPLRTPLFAAVLALLCAWLAQPGSPHKDLACKGPRLYQ